MIITKMQTGMKTMGVAAFSHKKMTKTLLILIFLFSCESITEEIVETHPSGNKKIVIKYNGNRNEENLIGKFYYLDDGTKFNSISYNVNGFIQSVHQMDEAKKIPIGRSLRFDKNHNIISDSNYKNGKLDGQWTIYTPDGIVMSKTFWKNGKKIKSL